MFRHPITESAPGRKLAGLLFLAAAAVVWGLLVLYGEIGTVRALGVAVIYVFFFLSGVFLYGFAAAYIPSRLLRIGVASGVLVFCLTLTGAVSLLLGWCDGPAFFRITPLLIIYGSMAWKILAL